MNRGCPDMVTMEARGKRFKQDFQHGFSIEEKNMTMDAKEVIAYLDYGDLSWRVQTEAYVTPFDLFFSFWVQT